MNTDLGAHPQAMTNLYGTAYEVGDKIVWACHARCANPLNVNRAGRIVAIGGPRRSGTPGIFKCATCHRPTATIFPPDEAGVKALEAHRSERSA